VSIALSYSDDFLKRLKKLPPNRQEAVIRALELFIEEPRLGRLRFRALRGHPGHFIINAARGDRIIIERIATDAYLALDVGTHDVYRVWDR